MNDNDATATFSTREPIKYHSGKSFAQFLERNNNQIVIRLEIPEVFSAGD